MNSKLKNAEFQVVNANMGVVNQSDVELTHDCKGMMVCFNAKTPGEREMED